MSILDFLFKKETEQPKPAVESLVSRINSSMEILSMKAKNFGDNLEEEKQAIIKLTEDASNFPPSDEIFAAKLEQDILCDITAANSACENALRGGNTEEIKAAVKKLARSVRQRTELRKV